MDQRSGAIDFVVVPVDTGAPGDPLLDECVASLATWGATDLIVTAGHPPYVRIDGDISMLSGEPLDAERVMAMLATMLRPDQVEQFAELNDVDFSLDWLTGERVRGNAFRQRGLPAFALRVIPHDIPSLDNLGLPTVAAELAMLQQGLILFTGPTGSGKSTTQAALIDSINHRRRCHILTIEDPIEYVHRNVNSIVSQREIGTDTPSFGRALRAALREDPDVLLVGEMRDLDSIAMALTLAETGHLVISTLHTNDASQAVDRIIDVFPPERQEQIRVQLAGSLSAVIAQRLIPREGGGLVAAYEVLLANGAARNLIREGKTRQLRNIISTSIGDGMQTMEMSLSALVRQGAISFDEACAHAFVPKEVVV